MIECGRLTFAFNQAFDPELQDLYAAKAQEARDLHHTIRRFIPKQFIQHLAAKHESDLKVGFADEADLAILLVDIYQNSSTSLS